MPEKLRVLIVAPNLNRDGLGEVYSIFKWVEALAERVDLTVLTLSRDDRLQSQLPNVQVVTFHEPAILARAPRFNAIVKPWLPIFFARVRSWIRAEQAKGVDWDIAHQVLPQAMRYASPFQGLGLTYVVGPLGGSIETPDKFRAEVGDKSIAARIRRLDRWRLRNDFRLRKGYTEAGLVLGVAHYVEDTLQAAGLTLQRFEPMLERAYEGSVVPPERQFEVGKLHLLHVGRVIRTKGLRDVIRALAQIPDLPNVHLTSAGHGPDLEQCKAEADRLGVTKRVTFLGQIPRQEVDRLYAEADVFCFPSFREPMGGVFFEAMEWGLPIIAARRGGPDFILDEQSAIKLSVETPEAFSADIAQAIRTLAEKPELRRQMGECAATRVKLMGSWADKAKKLDGLYREVVAKRASVVQG